MSYSVVVTESGRGRYLQDIVVNDRHRLLADEPETLGGDDAAPTPFDFLMTSLGTCTAITLRMYAERKNLAVTQISVALDHAKVTVDGQTRDHLRRRITIAGDLTGEQRQRMLEIANKCPLHRALTQPLLIASELAD